jgi:lipoyl(octanoyl) transferase
MRGKAIDRDLPCAWLGRQPYEPMWQRLRDRAEIVARDCEDEIVWSCEHEPVYTTGKRGIDNSLSHLPAPFVPTDRGGETTFHGPGQLMLYPIVHLRRRGLGAKNYLHLIEQSCIKLLRGFGVVATRRHDAPGVWLDDAKIAAVGLRIQRGVAYHGMALNVDVAHTWFAAIRPCGLRLPVANLSAHMAHTPPLPDIAQLWHRHLNGLLKCRAPKACV